MTDTMSVRRGRPRSFDREIALRKAMRVFQANGYEGTSMMQLVEAMGIGSPSIYAAFGSKEALFREAVELYAASEVEPAWQALDEILDARLAVRTMLLSSIDTYVANGPQRGCLVMLGANHLGSGDDSVRRFLRDQRRRYHDRLAARLSRGIEDGHIPSDVDPGTLAECVLAFFGGLTIEAVDGTRKDTLHEAAGLFCARMFGDA
ncbi:TetR/AcrR family transcriptional regulator [Henriciella aquimarina]|uniref:TetR/AcrR family transcriptional regulator n=1 Tax=Henriciella aquimarina TaxID=545261 RepID=UPI000A06D0EF|nr:TetR/AcrR family transcriptional regulator [Henriciella aquimarina]